jgi:hypothetical protein
MKITFVLPTLSLTGGMRVLSIYTELLQNRGEKIFIVSTPPGQATLIQQLRSLLRGRGWQSPPKKEQSHFDKVDVESRVLETYCPITDKDIPDADIIMATWWETAEWVAKLSPSKGTKVYFLQNYEAFDYVPKGRVESTKAAADAQNRCRLVARRHSWESIRRFVCISRPSHRGHQTVLRPPVASEAAARQAISSHSRDVLYYNCLERLRYCPESFLYSW